MITGRDRGKEFDWRKLSSRMGFETIVKYFRTDVFQFTLMGYRRVSEPPDARVTYGNRETSSMRG